MEQKKGQSFNTATGESKSTEGDWTTRNRESKADGFKDFGDRKTEFYDETKKTISDTYNKTAEALNKGYDQAIAYSRQNPGTAVLIALGSGLVVGLLLASRSRGRQNFYSSYAEPVVNTLADVVSDVFRRL